MNGEQEEGTQWKEVLKLWKIITYILIKSFWL